MSKACTKSKTRLKKHGSHKKSETKQGPDQSLANIDVAKTVAAKIQHGHGSKDVQIQELDYNDRSELHLCSQEPLLNSSSQDVDGHSEVRWDCQSPETVNKLKKYQGQYSSNEIRQIVDNFRDAPTDPLLHSVRFCLPLKDEIVLARQSRLQKERGKVCRKHKLRVQNKDSLQQMILLFHDQTAKPKSDFKRLCQQLSEAPVNHLTASDDRSVGDISSGLSKSIVSEDDDNCWSDDELFQDNSFLIEATQNPEKFLNAAEVPQQCIFELKHPMRNICTSVPEDSLIFSSRSEANEPLVDESLLADSFVIPSSCASKNSTILGAKTSVPELSSSTSSHSTSSNAYTKNTNQLRNLQRIGLHNNITATTALVSGCITKQSHVKSTANSADKHSSNSVINLKPSDITTSRLAAFESDNLNISNVNKFVSQNSQSIIVNSLPGATYKTSFKKFNSFQVDNSLSRNRNVTDGNKEISNCNSSFRKSLSFDSSLSATNLKYRKNKLSVPNFSEFVAKPESMLAANLRSQPDNVAKSRLTEIQIQPGEVQSVVPAMQEDGFDVSLPDDVFQKLLEVDEILDSQAGVITTTSILSQLCDKKVPLLDKLSNTILDVTTAKLDALNTNMTSLPTTVNGHTSSRTTYSKKNSTKTVCDIPGTNNNQLNAPKLTETLLSPVRSVVSFQNKQRVRENSPSAYFKKTFSLKKNSLHHPRAEAHLRSSLPSSSTPVKYTKNDGPHHIEDQDATLIKETSASFLDNVFDDSFTNDEAMFESQILPVLEKLEAEALQTQSELSNSIKCSSKEIEEKRQAALQKRSIKLSQMSTASSQKPSVL